jgi:hypothetical protein
MKFFILFFCFFLIMLRERDFILKISIGNLKRRQLKYKAWQNKNSSTEKNCHTPESNETLVIAEGKLQLWFANFDLNRSTLTKIKMSY